LSYSLDIADLGWQQAARDPVLAAGVNVVEGPVTPAAVAEAHGVKYAPLEV